TNDLPRRAAINAALAAMGDGTALPEFRTYLLGFPTSDGQWILESLSLTGQGQDILFNLLTDPSLQSRQVEVRHAATSWAAGDLELANRFLRLAREAKDRSLKAECLRAYAICRDSDSEVISQVLADPQLTEI